MSTPTRPQPTPQSHPGVLGWIQDGLEAMGAGEQRKAEADRQVADAALNAVRAQAARLTGRPRPMPAPAGPAALPAGLRGPIDPTAPQAWRWPLDDHFSLTRSDGRHQGAGGFHARGGVHKGVDIEAPVRSPVYAAADGVVARSDSRDARGYGLRIDLAHDQHSMSRYAHLHASVVRPGDRVRQGQLIGYVGQTGNATGLPYPHLHFETRQDGRPVDPAGRYPQWDSVQGRMR